MTHHFKLHTLTAFSLACAVLAGCGGGDAEAPPPPAAASPPLDVVPGPDTTPPTLTQIANDVSAPTATGPVTFTFLFSEDVGTSFGADDIVVIGGTKGAFARTTSGAQATLVVVPIANSTGTIDVSVAAGRFSDLAGNANTVGASAQKAYSSVVKTQMALPVNFDSATVDYGFIGFGGAEASSLAADPANAANSAAKVVRAAGAETYAGTTITAAAGLGFTPKIPFNANDTRMSVRVWSPDAGIPVRLKVEDHADANKSVEAETTTTTANAWQTLTFNFATQVAGTAPLNLAFNYDKATIFFDFGRAKASAVQKTYYFDDVAFVPGAGGAGGGGGGAVSGLPVTFDDAAVTYKLTGFGGAEDATVVSGVTGANGKVAKIIKSATAELWAGTTVSTGANDSIATIPFTASAKTMTLRVYTPAAGIPVRLKVEDAADVTHTVETEAVTTVAGGWETLTFNFATPAAGTAALNLAFTYNKASVFFNFGKTGGAGGAGTYYFDDLSFVPAAGGGGGGGGAVSGLPVTFDDAAVTYTLTGFGGAEDATVVSGVAGANGKVAKIIKSAGAELWAGTTVSTGANASIATIPFTASAKTMTLRVYTPAAGIPVRLKVEDAADGTHTVETEAITTVAGGWETLTFNFATQAPGTAALNLSFTYNKASVFFNFGKAGGAGGAGTYYFDELNFVAGAAGGGGGSSGSALLVTFDDAAVTYTLTGFGGAEDATVVSGVAGANGKVAKIIKSATAELWAGTTVSTGANESIATIAFTASAKTMSLRVYTPAAGIPVRLKVETAGDPTRSVETEAVTTVAGGWETLTFNFATQAPGTAALNLAFTYNKASVFFNFGKPGAAGGAGTYYFDELKLN